MHIAYSVYTVYRVYSVHSVYGLCRLFIVLFTVTNRGYSIYSVNSMHSVLQYTLRAATIDHLYSSLDTHQPAPGRRGQSYQERYNKR